MKRLIAVVLLLCSASFAQPPSATTVRIGLFTTRTVHGVTITPLNHQAWQQDCDACVHKPLQSPIHLDYITTPLQLGGSLRVQPDGDIAPIEASGLFRLTTTPSGLHIILQMPSENYVAAVLSGEAAPDEPHASLEALATVARTFALSNEGRHAAEGFDLCDSTHCQALRIGHLPPAILQAVRNTAGITLWSGNRHASVYYTQHCGGTSEAATAVWSAEKASYLISHTDPYCLRRSPAQWQTDITVDELSQIAAQEHWRIPQHLSAARITQRTSSGRASLITLSGDGAPSIVSATSLRFAVNRSLGWNRLRSDLYAVTLTGNRLHFSGVGYGHGVGLCQAGAFQMAIERHTPAEILAFYFPGTHIGLTPTTTAWQSQAIDGISLRTIAPRPSLAQTIRLAWQQALSLSHTTGDAPYPTITLAPTTELFRQLTSSPGYLLAITQGEQITLQPLNILQRNGPLQPLLLHELLHVLIEADSAPQAPLWLREGLAEALSTLDQPFQPPQHSLQQVEQELAHPTTLAASQQAHREAASFVRTLGRTYSVETMRGWLHHGVPPPVLQQLH